MNYNFNQSIVLLMLMGCALTACEKEVMSVDGVTYDDEGREQREVRFTVAGDFELSGFDGDAESRRASLQADGKAMTDLWVLDYVDGELVQQIHQESGDEDFGEPEMTLTFGNHHVYFVASRGGSPTLTTTSHTITWDIARDTFWRDLQLSVSGSTSSSVAVALDRVSTKVTLRVTDEVPDGIATITVTPAIWYYGLNYMTGAATNPVNAGTELAVPSSWIGTDDKMNVSLYGMSPTDEWETDITVVARDGDDNILGQATISDAPFMRNRVTNYQGALFNGSPAFAVSLNSDWEEAYNGTW